MTSFTPCSLRLVSPSSALAGSVAVSLTESVTLVPLPASTVTASCKAARLVSPYDARSPVSGSSAPTVTDVAPPVTDGPTAVAVGLVSSEPEHALPRSKSAMHRHTSGTAIRLIAITHSPSLLPREDSGYVTQPRSHTLLARGQAYPLMLCLSKRQFTSAQAGFTEAESRSAC